MILMHWTAVCAAGISAEAKVDAPAGCSSKGASTAIADWRLDSSTIDCVAYMLTSNASLLCEKFPEDFHGYAVNRGVALIDTMERRVVLNMAGCRQEPHETAQNIDQLVFGAKSTMKNGLFFFQSP